MELYPVDSNEILFTHEDPYRVIMRITKEGTFEAMGKTIPDTEGVYARLIEWLEAAE